MNANPHSHSADDAMLTWLAGDESVNSAANRLWEATGRLTSADIAFRAAQFELEAATDAYSVAIRASRIPLDDVERLGAALILRVGRTRTLVDTEAIIADDSDNDPAA